MGRDFAIAGLIVCAIAVFGCAIGSWLRPDPSAALAYGIMALGDLVIADLIAHERA